MLEKHNKNMGAAGNVSCCCRANHPLATYQIGFAESDWLIDDIFYGGLDSRNCAGAVDPDYMRVYYR